MNSFRADISTQSGIRSFAATAISEPNYALLIVSLSLMAFLK